MKRQLLNVLILLPAFVLGAGLRLYLLPDQVLLDDEWHALNYVIGADYGGLFLRSPWIGATGAPMNLYTFFLLQDVGWNELWLRLPSMAAGLLGLIVLPLLVWKIFNRGIAFIFSLLLAISPFLTFYSRVARPYAMVALLGAVSLLAFWNWVIAGVERRLRWAILSAVAGVLAIWFHPFAAIGVLTPVAWVIGYSVYLKYRPAPSSGDSSTGNSLPSPMRLALLFAMILVPSALLHLSALLNPESSGLMTSAGHGQIRFSSFIGAVEIMCGVGNTPLVLVLGGIAMLGTVRLLLKMPILGGGLIASFAAYLLVLIVFRPGEIQVFIVICRYLIVLLPMFLITVSIGLGAITQAVPFFSDRKKGAVFVALGMLLCAGLFIAGPLPRTCKAPNNFTNHCAFQESYRLAPATRFYQSQVIPLPKLVEQENVPAFYHKLAQMRDVTMVIEYPMFCGDHLNLLYFYQQLHGKRAKIGWLPRPQQPSSKLDDAIRAAANRSPFIPGDSTPDEILGEVPDRAKLRIRNIVDLTDFDRVRACGADLLILHKDMPGELLGRRTSARPSRRIALIATNYFDEFGKPVFEDNQLIVFNLRPNLAAKQLSARRMISGWYRSTNTTRPSRSSSS